MVKNVPAIQETWVQSLCLEDPWRREWLPTPVFLPGEFHEQRSPWDHKESDTTERLKHPHTDTHTHTTKPISQCGTVQHQSKMRTQDAMYWFGTMP